jgi:hypothetical protein
LYNAYAGGDVIDGDEMAQALNTEIRAFTPEGYYWYFFGHSTNDTSPTRVLEYMCVMMDYYVDYYHPGDPGYPPLNGHPDHVPAAVPIGGSYENWVAVRGIHTNKTMWPPWPENLVIYGLWLDDPTPDGWSHTYVPGEVFVTDFFQMIDGEYHAVVDPPADNPVKVPSAESTATIAASEPADASTQRFIKFGLKRGGLIGQIAENALIQKASYEFNQVKILDCLGESPAMPDFGIPIDVQQTENGYAILTDTDCKITLDENIGLYSISIL